MDRISPGNATRLALDAAGLPLAGWAGMLGCVTFGPDMALAAGSLSLCF